MAKRTVSDYRSDIRTQLDLDESDLPDAMLDTFIRAGARYAQRWNQGLWPFYEMSWTYSWPADTASQTLTQIEDGSTDLINKVRYLRSDDVRTFSYLSEQDFHKTIQRDNSNGGIPYVWSPSANGETITLFPQPSAITEVDVDGWKKASDWVSDGAPGESDMPEQFDEAVFAYACGMAYQSQDEGQTAVFWLNMADVHLSQLEDEFDAGPPVDMIMNGGAISQWRPETPGRLRFDFEVGL